MPRDSEAPRTVVISHPFAPDGGNGVGFELLSLSSAGALSTTGVTFTMGTAQGGRIAITPDGRLGLVAQQDGSLGAFRLEDDGGVTVFPPPDGGPYLSNLVMSSDGTRAIGIDEDTLNNGGGLYDLEIGCDDSLAWHGSLGIFDTPDAFAFLPSASSRAILSGGNPLQGDAGPDTELLAPLADGGPVELGSVVAFPDHSAIPSAIAVTMDDQFAFVADNGLFAGNRVALLAIGGGGLTPLGMLSTPNPVDLAASPFADTVLVLNSDGMDNLSPIFPSPDAGSAVFVVGPPLAYVGTPPQLPAEAVVIERGSLLGRVVIGENVGVRQVQFETDGGIVDLGVFSFGNDIGNIVGALGVQP